MRASHGSTLRWSSLVVHLASSTASSDACRTNWWRYWACCCVMKGGQRGLDHVCTTLRRSVDLLTGPWPTSLMPTKSASYKGWSCCPTITKVVTEVAIRNYMPSTALQGTAGGVPVESPICLAREICAAGVTIGCPMRSPARHGQQCRSDVAPPTVLPRRNRTPSPQAGPPRSCRPPSMLQAQPCCGTEPFRDSWCYILTRQASPLHGAASPEAPRFRAGAGRSAQLRSLRCRGGSAWHGPAGLAW